MPGAVRADRMRLPTVLLSVALLLACDAQPSPSVHHVVELPGYGTLVIDVEMTDTWEKSYSSEFRFEPRDGGPLESVVTHYASVSRPRVLRVDVKPQVRFERQHLEPLVLLAGERVLLRLPQAVAGSESLIVRAGTNDWRRYDFDDRSLERFAAWQAALRPYDAQHGGFSELVHLDLSRRTFTYYRHGGYLVRKLIFALAADGRSIDLKELRRAPLEARHVGPFNPAWRSAALLSRARDLFVEARLRAPLSREPDWALANARLVALHDCPDSGPADRLQVLFEMVTPRDIGNRTHTKPDRQGYRTELWYFHRVGDDWQVAGDFLPEPSSAEILERNRAGFDELRDCIKVY